MSEQPIYIVRLYRSKRTGVSLETFFCFENNARLAVEYAKAGKTVDGSYWEDAEYLGLER